MSNWKITGVVDTIGTDTITLWLSGFPELQTVPIVDTMPEWLFEVDMGFRTTIPRACVIEQSLNNNWGEFTKQDYQDLTELELWIKLSQVLE